MKAVNNQCIDTILVIILLPQVFNSHVIFCICCLLQVYPGGGGLPYRTDEDARRKFWN